MNWPEVSIIKNILGNELIQNNLNENLEGGNENLLDGNENTRICLVFYVDRPISKKLFCKKSVSIGYLKSQWTEWIMKYLGLLSFCLGS